MPLLPIPHDSAIDVLRAPWRVAGPGAMRDDGGRTVVDRYGRPVLFAGVFAGSSVPTIAEAARIARAASAAPMLIAACVRALEALHDPDADDVSHLDRTLRDALDAAGVELPTALEG